MIALKTDVIASEWTLGRLAGELGLTLSAGAALPVWGIEEDSRLCGPGDLFIAIPGSQTSGVEFAADAVERGAVAVAAETDPGVRVPWLPVPSARAAAGALADSFFGHPSRRIPLVGVTGTNGKTTTAHLLAQLLPGKVGTIGTMGVRYGAVVQDSPNTTPGPTALRRALRSMVDAGCSACVMEVSSHALDQRRADGLRFAGAIYTNLTQDHLDYHGTMLAYAAAKARLLAMLSREAFAVVNAQSACSAIATPARRTTFRAQRVSVSPRGTEFDWRGRRMRTSLVGSHNAENALAALEAAAALGVSEEEAAARLAAAAPVRGRLEVIAREPALVVVDYAHTDDALQNALRALREVTAGPLTVVFGCGGDRDVGKRPRMGAVADRLAHRVIVTNDNPRSEDPARIAEQICRGIPRKDVTVILERRAAIEEAVLGARPGGCVLIAGKGHETVQILGDRKIPFDDAEEARRALAVRHGSLALNHE